MTGRPGLVATVMIPTTAGRGPLLPLSVGSVLAQTVRDLEVFVLGDGVDEATRRVILDLAARDPRIRFFDAPKDVRRGERRRHAALAEARGRIVCHLCDRDLMLPDHVDTLDRLLRDADFAHTLRFGIDPEGGYRFRHFLDITDSADRARAPESRGLIPFSFVGHTLEAYERLPFGWRVTPPGESTDRMMWLQFLADPACRTAASDRPTVLYFKRGDHPGWPVDRRLAELEVWRKRLEQPGALDAVRVEATEAARGARPLRVPAAPGSSLRDGAKQIRDRLMTLLDPLRPGQMRRTIRLLRPPAPRSARPHITRLETATLQPTVRLEAYWVGESFGPGPAASLYIRDDEVMRFDCFGGDRGHLHLNLSQARLMQRGTQARMFFPPGSVSDHIERACFELERNLDYALALNRNPRIRATRIDPERLAQATHWLKDYLNALAKLEGGDAAVSGGETRDPG